MKSYVHLSPTADRHMQKTIIVTVFILLLPAASFAREKMLYDITDDIITLAEAIISCADPKNTCTETDAIALKADAENSLEDIVELIKFENLTRLQLSPEQILCLSSRLESLNSLLAHIEIFNRACNRGIALINRAIPTLSNGLYYVTVGIEGVISIVEIVPGVFFILIGTMLILMGLLFILPGCLLLLACVFWWI